MTTKEYSTKQFLQFRPMVEKAVWKYSKKYHLDFTEIEGQGYLFFCEALETFDEQYNCKLSTHIYHKLTRLDSYCNTLYSRNQSIQHCKKDHRRGYGKSLRMPFMNITEIDTIFDYDIFSKVLDKIDYEISLSDDAKDILQYILSREWEDVETNWIPRLSHIKKVYTNKGWAGNRIKDSWNEIKLWWQESNKDQFCMEV